MLNTDNASAIQRKFRWSVQPIQTLSDSGSELGHPIGLVSTVEVDQTIGVSVLASWKSVAQESNLQ